MHACGMFSQPPCGGPTSCFPPSAMWDRPFLRVFHTDGGTPPAVVLFQGGDIMGEIYAFIPQAGRSNVDCCVQVNAVRHQGGVEIHRLDSIAQEVCVRVFVDGFEQRPQMCSPWDLEELVVGSLFIGGTIDCADDVTSIRVEHDTLEVHVELSDACRARRAAGVSAAVRRVVSHAFSLCPDEVVRAISKLENDSALFHCTGGVHCAALLDGDDFACWFEDIGRHNALDKLAGWCVMHDVDVSNKPLVFSGRIPYEIISKVARLGCPMIISPGAPTSLSVDVACECGITLVGFAKHGRFNVYSGFDRVHMNGEREEGALIAL